jgi:hypothetical protein
MNQATIFHPLYGYSMCYGSYNGVPVGFTHPEHGTLVACMVCGRTGVIPDEGHELEFLPPGTERDPGGGFIFRPQVSYPETFPAPD